MTKQIKAKIPESWVIEVEETQKLGYGNGILVFRDSNTNQKIYVKLCKPEDIQKGLIFEFVDPNYLRELGVQETVIEESYNTSLVRKSQVHEKFVEESVPEHKETPEEYEKWKAEHALAEQKPKQPSNLVININNKPTEGEGTEDKEPFDLEAKQIEIFKQFNDERVFDAKTKEELVSFTTNLVNEGLEAKKPKPETPSGSMPLNDVQIKGYVQKQDEFASEAELIADLKKREREGDQLASKILNRLYTKMAKGLMKKGVEFIADENDQPTLKEITKKKERD
jgi:hypothetical protein